MVTDLPYRPVRDHRYDNAGEAIEHIEALNCSKGCKVPDPSTVEPEAPGGSCLHLLNLLLETEDESLIDRGDWIECMAREPLDV